ncbi:MAG: AmmeMemoRadiSam system protein B [Candidatus Omnitrophota bacterium]
MMEQTKLRKPIAAGQFYPSDAKNLKGVISDFSDKDKVLQKKEVIGAILPHAGYVYSGQVAVATVSGIDIKDNVVMLGPNHTGLGLTFSVMPNGVWQTPFGNVKINQEIVKLFLNKSQYLVADAAAHQDEHSLEVELPILQYFKRNFKIIPIAIKTFNLSLLKGLAIELADVINTQHLKSSTIFIASSDMTHYESEEVARKKDAQAIEAIVALDEDRLEKIVKALDVSMCGFAPIAVLIKTAKLLGAKGAELIKYQTSGQTSGDLSSVVGYAGITIY